MNPEEELDYLIEQYLSDASWQPDVSDEDAAKIAAAGAIANLNMIEPPLSLSARLESRIRMQARAHQDGRVLNLEQERQNGRVVSLEQRPRRRTGARRIVVSRAWIGALGTVAVLLLALLGVSNVAAGSLPGDPLYGLKHLEQQVAVSNANSPAERANLQITQLQGAIADLQTAVGAGRSDEGIKQALSVVANDTHDSQAAVAALPAGSERDAAEQSLTNTLQNEQATLYALLARVDWSLRVAFTQQLGALGVAILTVTKVTVTKGANNTLVLKLTGTNFVAGAQLVINGRVRGTVSQSIATTLTATINASDWHEDERSVGVLNPDGTAAQKIVGDDEQDGSGGGGQATPGPGITPTPGDGGD